MLDNKLFRAGLWILLVFLIILVGSHISFIFQPVLVILSTLFFPVLIAGVLYFASYPFVDWLQKQKVPRVFAIIILFLLLIGLLVLIIFTVGPALQREFRVFVMEVPQLLRELQKLVLTLEQIQLAPRFLGQETLDIRELAEQVTSAVNSLFKQFVAGITGIIEFMTNLFMIIILVPFILFYFLKDGSSMKSAVTGIIPEDYRTGARKTMSDIHMALSSYIQGLFIVCLAVGILGFIGFKIIGLNYALVLALFMLVTNVIPYLGPFIGAIPALIVGALDSPAMMFKVAAVIIIVQQIESLVIAPQVMGRKLSLNPLTIILILMVAGRLGGLLGMIIAVPLFAAGKILFSHVYSLIVRKT